MRANRRLYLIYDDGLLTFALDRDMFTVSLTSLRAQGPIWYAEQGVFITDAGDSTTFAEYRKSIRGKQTVAQDVVAMQEQSLSGARNGQPRPHPIPYCFGCTHSRQKFWIEPNGDIDLISWFVKVPEGRDSPRWKNENTARFMFGLGRWSVDGRFNDPWPVMAYNIRMKRGDLLLHQKAFAVPLQSSILAGEPRPDDTIVALVRFRFENTGDEAVPAAIKVAYSNSSSRTANRRLVPAVRADAARRQTDELVPLVPRETLEARDGAVTGRFKDERVFRCAYETSMTATDDDGISFAQLLAPGEACTLLLRIPYVTLQDDAERDSLGRLDFDRCYAEMKEYWRREGRRGARVHTPEPHLDAVYAGHLPIVLISDIGTPDGSGLVNTSVGTATYGNFANESCMILEELDQRGLVEQVRRRFGMWVRHQGTVPLQGNFSDHDGVFYGAGGLESGMYYCQHHGWVLWYLARHFAEGHGHASAASFARTIPYNRVACEGPAALCCGLRWIIKQSGGKQQTASGVELILKTQAGEQLTLTPEG